MSNAVTYEGKSAIQRILDAAKGTDYYAIIHTAMHTSKRRNELLAIRLRDLDLEKGVMYVRYSIHGAKGETIFQTPKRAPNLDLCPRQKRFNCLKIAD